MSLLLCLALGLLAGAAVYNVYVTHITKYNAIRASKDAMSESEMKKAFKARVKEKTGTSIKLDVLDSMGSSVCEVNVTGEDVARDIVRGDILYV